MKTTELNAAFLYALTLLFIGLKLTDSIDWSWTWVLSPLWIPIALIIVVVTIWVVALGLTNRLK